jgi:ATP-dependent Lhr-like helicase
MAARAWSPADFQREVWQAIQAGHSGLLHASTGSGKTLAVWLGILQASHSGSMAAPEVASEAAPASKHAAKPTKALPAKRASRPLCVLWVTPMRALAADTLRALTEPLADLQPTWTLGLRTGDTPSAERARQDRRLPTVLVTTPESLSLLLARADAPAELGLVTHVVVDEWHELMGNKRGVQVQLALARLRSWQPRLVVWGLSATLGNAAEAAQALCGVGAQPLLVRGHTDKTLLIDTLLPSDPGRYAWAGHLGARMLQPVVDELAASSTTLVFTNTRSQAEIWYQMLLQARPDWAGEIALHHASLDHAVRDWVEQALKAGRLRAVVATSSLDLGVDFLPVERVLQIGSAKGVARLLQRAGRSGHAPGRPSRITLVPTNTLEIIEAAAARQAALAQRVEPRHSPEQPLDVLVQHLVTVALGGGFDPEALWQEVRSTWAYRALERSSFDWALAFCERGGDSLHAYPDYHRIQPDEAGVYRVADNPQGRAVARRHRLGIGTIVSDAAMQVKWLSGGTIGTVEEGFIARLNKGDCFVFAGRLLEFVRVKDLAAYVKKATRQRGTVPTWQGGKMPLSTEMADAVLERLQEAQAAMVRGDLAQHPEPELRAAQALLETQAALSRLPLPGRLLVETFTSREGHHLWLYPFAGRTVHTGLASLLAWRLAQAQPQTFSLAVNDYGLELLSADPIDAQAIAQGQALSPQDLLAHVLASLNASELAQRRFREIARVAGLVFTGYPGASKSLRQLQASSALFFEVFRQYDAGNLLLGQAEREVLSQELAVDGLQSTLERLSTYPIDVVPLRQPSPMGLPLMVERLRERLSTEKLADRLARMLAEMEAGLETRPGVG